jgi:hypothetical protein
MNHPITNLVKWAAKTAQAVQKICLTRQGPCVGICLLFLEMDDKGEKKWYFTTHMAGDGEEGMDNPERKKLERAMEMGAKAMQMAYDDVDESYDVTTINELSSGGIH